MKRQDTNWVRERRRHEIETEIPHPEYRTNRPTTNFLKEEKNRHIKCEDIQIVNGQIKPCSISVVTREMQSDRTIHPSEWLKFKC